MGSVFPNFINTWTQIISTNGGKVCKELRHAWMGDVIGLMGQTVDGVKNDSVELKLLM